MENLKITEKLSDGTQTELRISDVIGRLLQRVELLYGSDDEWRYTIQYRDKEYWVVRHIWVPYERESEEKLVRVNDL
jgi:phage protein D